MAIARLHRATTMLAPADLAGFVDSLAAHEIRVVTGLAEQDLGESLAFAPPTLRPVLQLDLGAAETAEAVVDTAIRQLASAVGGLWPFLWGGEDFSHLRDDPLSRAHLPIRLAALAGHVPQLAQGWARDVVIRLLRGRSPRLPAVAPSLEWAQLVHAFSPGGLTIVVPMQAGPLDGWVRALEWLAAHGPVAVVATAADLPNGGAVDRILFGARQMAPRLPAAGVPSPGAPRPVEATDGPVILALPAAEGRPHPQSATELRLYAMIEADRDLQPLFAFNRFVPDLPLLQAKADLLWLEGRVVVEIDGHEHRAAAKFRADRHRDYELMCAGYHVLRLTNADVAADAALAIEKIRAVVRLARKEGR